MIKKTITEKIIRKKFAEVLACGDITLNGNRPWDMQIHNEKIYRRIALQGSLALGESYVEGWWDAEQLDEFFYRIYFHSVQKQHKGLADLLARLQSFIINEQTKHRARKVGEAHYDISNDLYRRMLDKRMIYSCGYWKNADNLDDAQEAKLRLIGDKLQLKPGMRVLDIGCGWGGTARFMAETYGVEVLGITISKQQARLAEENCQGLPIEIRVQDYREVNDTFDAIFSIGMFEHVGYKNYREYMKLITRTLQPHGLFLLHTIGRGESIPVMDPWLTRYIFPNSMLPSPEQIGQAINGIMVLEDWHNMGIHYDKTLMAWFDHFNQHWPEIENAYPENFERLWKYYLMASTSAFRARHLQLWQIVLSPKGVMGGYDSIR